jgi:hypothetical protein
MRILGLDLGQSQDPAAAALVDRVTEEPPGFVGPRNPNFGMRIVCQALRLWPLGTDYTQIVSDVLDVNADAIVVDFGGVGRPVVDVMRKEAVKRNRKTKIRPVQLIGSSGRAQIQAEARGSHWNVPKIDIVGSLILCQQKKQLWLPKCQETTTLLEQLRAFQMRITKAANLQFGNSPAGGHDDLVVALGLACWYARRFGVGKFAIFVG